MNRKDTYVISIPYEKSVFPFQLRTVGYVQAKAGDTYRRDNYKWCIVEYIVTGEGVLEANGRNYFPKAGDLYILHKGKYHKYYAMERDPWKKIYFELDGSLMMDLLRTYQLHNTYYIPQCGLKYAFEQMFQIAKANQWNVHQQAALLFHQMLSDIREQRGPTHSETDDDLLIVKEFLDSATESKVTMADISRLVGRTSSHLIRKFKKEFHITPYDYLLNRRIETAKLYLSNTGVTVKEIAFRLQFANEYYFSSFFKQKVGESPSHFRKRKQ